MCIKPFILLFFITLVGSIAAAGSVETLLDKEKLYSAMSSDDLKMVDAELKRIESSGDVEAEAFEGALLMKKAGLIKGAKQKLDVFKEGHKKLESAIKADTAHAEFRFLRLMIQENAPKILGYHKELETDQSLLKSKFNLLILYVSIWLLFKYCIANVSV